MRLSWNTGEHIYHSGVDRVVLYSEEYGVAWNGVTAIAEAPSSSPKPRYSEGRKIGSEMSPEGFNFTLSAFTYPEEFEPFDGTQGIAWGQARKSFDLSYRTRIGENAYLIHLVYNALAAPSNRTRKSAGDSVDTTDFAWECSTKPVPMSHARSSAHLILDTRFAYSWVVDALDDLLYGTDDALPQMPDPDVVWNLVEAGSILLVTDLGDHIFQIDGPDSIVSEVNTPEHLWQIGPWASVIQTDTDTYQISSL